MSNKEPIIFYHRSMKGLAYSLASQTGFELGDISWKRFPDDSPQTFIKNKENFEGRKVIFIASFHTDKAMNEQLGVIYALPRYESGPLHIILPYFPGTMDRVDEGKDGVIVTAKTVARMLSVTPASHNGGVPLCTIFDIHDRHEQFYPDDGIIFSLKSAIPLFKGELQNAYKSSEEVAIAFPDEGARKRFGRLFDDYEIIVCDKIRGKNEKRIVTLREGNPCNKHVVIVDDLIMSGGTMIECCHVLKNAGAKTVSAYATHGIFPKKSWQKFTPDLFDHVWITNSRPSAVKVAKNLKNFKVLDLASSIAKIIKK